MKIRKLLAIGALLVITGVFAFGCGSSDESSETTEESKDLKVVRIASPGVDSDGNAAMQESAAVAQAEGYFEEELNKIGYTAEYYGFSTAGTGVNEALAAEEADVAVYGDFPAITYIASGNEATIFAIASDRYQVGIYVNDTIESVEDLKGKNIGVTLGTTAYKFLVQYLEKNGLSVDDVEVVNASSDLGTLYSTGDVDAVVQSVQLFYSLDGGKTLAINGDDEELQSDFVVLGRNDYLEENPDVASAVVKALNRAQEYAAENQDSVYDILAGLSGYYTSDVYKDIYSFNDSFEYWSAYIRDDNIAALQDTCDFMYENGYITSEVNVEDIIDTSVE